MKNISKILGLSLITSSVLYAATPNSGTILRDIQTPKDLPKKSTPLVDIGGIEKYKAPMTDDKSGKTIFVKEFKLTGVKHIKQELLKELIKEYENKDLNFSQLQEVASLITKKYREQGYFVARAYLPVQDIKNDIFEIAIIEGNYGEFNLHNNSLVKNSKVQAMLDEIKTKDIINTHKIERAMLLINDTAGVTVTKAQIKPGNTIGTSDFDIETEASNKVSGYVVADNYGSRYTGQNRLNASISVNSPFKIGDKLSLGGLVSNGADLKNGSLNYEVPLLPNGLKATIGYSYTKYRLIEEYENLNASGDADTISASVSYPLIRTKNENLYLKGTYYHKNMTDYMDGDTSLDKDIDSVELSTNYQKNYELLGKPSTFNTTASLTAGTLSTTDTNADHGRYNKLNLSISNITALNQTFSLTTALTAQKVIGGKSLDGSEDISLGGAYGVKAYSSSEQSGENGYIVNLELFSQLPNIDNYTHKLSLFYDIGDVYLEDSSSDANFQRKTLQDIGLGYYANYDNFFLKSNLAYTINHEVTAEPEYGSKFLVQAGWVF
jgi:hemolysin activation/secretion protein